MLDYAVYSIHDRAAGEYARPFYCGTHPDHVHARRLARDLVDRDNLVRANPADFSLVHCGTFRTDSGTFDSFEPREVVGMDKLIDAPVAK